MADDGMSDPVDQDLVDREKESDTVSHLMQQNDLGGILIYAPKGVGKSAFTRKLMKVIRPKRTEIRVETAPNNDKLSLNQADFLKRVVETCERVARKTGGDLFSAEEFLQCEPNDIMKRKDSEGLIEDIKEGVKARHPVLSLPAIMLARLYSQYAGCFNYDPSVILNPTRPEDFVVASSYVNYFIRSIENCAIIIENAQSIDESGCQHLKQWLNTAIGSSVLFILEYTTTNGCEEALRFMEKLKTYPNETLVDFPLGYMDEDHAITVASRDVENDVVLEAARAHYKKSHGNLFELKSFFRTSFEEVFEEKLNPDFARLVQSTPDEKYLLAIVFLHGGDIRKARLEEIADMAVDFHGLAYEALIEDLVQSRGILRQSGFRVAFSHSSLQDAWKENLSSFKKYNLVGYRSCRDYYQRNLQSAQSPLEVRQDSFSILLRLHAKYHPAELIELMQYLGSAVTGRMKPRDIWMAFERLIEWSCKTKSEALGDSALLIAQYCYDRGLYSEALSVYEHSLETSAYQRHSLKWDILRINCLEGQERHEEAIAFCTSLLETRHDDYSRYLLFLALMGCYRSLNEMKKVLGCVEAIESISNYQKYNEYGIFLRFKEMYLPRKEAIPFLEQSVEFFEARKITLQEVKSRITYSFLLAVDGSIERARSELGKCKRLLGNTDLFAGAIALDEASLLIREGRYGMEVKAYLDQAILLCNLRFDKILIFDLMIINCYECLDPLLDDVRMTLLDHLNSEVDKHLLAGVYCNLARISLEVGDRVLATEYAEHAFKYKDYSETARRISESLLDGQVPEKWCCGATFFWNVDCLS